MSDTFRLLPSDESPHQPDSSLNFNESVYGNAFDVRTGVGGWMRVGNRANEGHAEKSVVLYLPDGNIAVSIARPPITSNDQFSADGLSVELIEPFRHQRMRYEGELLLLDDPDLLRDPKRMYADARRTTGSVLWDQRSNNPLHGGVPISDDQPTMYGRDFSLGHFNQHIDVSGHIRVGDEHYPIKGHGWRDHSWGPRYWTNIFFYRLFLATFDSGNGIMLLKRYNLDGTADSRGALLIDGIYDEVCDLNVNTRWGDSKDPLQVQVGVRTATRSTMIEAEIIRTAPLRNRRKDGGVTLESRISESITRFRWEGREAFGMTEYIERIENGVPVGWPV